jgi:Gram-negative bacterial TonB protein C-terminal
MKVIQIILVLLMALFGGTCTAQQSTPTPPDLNVTRFGPTCYYMPMASYTKEAKKAKFEGVVLAAATVMPDGTLSDLKILKSPGLGLNDNSLSRRPEDAAHGAESSVRRAVERGEGGVAETSQQIGYLCCVDELFLNVYRSDQPQLIRQRILIVDDHYRW